MLCMSGDLLRGGGHSRGDLTENIVEPSARSARGKILGRVIGQQTTAGDDDGAIAHRIDLFEEARGLEMHERLATGDRGRFAVSELVDAMTVYGHAALGWPEAGRVEVGAFADLVSVRTDSVRTAGVLPEQVVMAASAADIDTLLVAGRPVVQDGRHLLIEHPGHMLVEAVDQAWG